MSIAWKRSRRSLAPSRRRITVLMAGPTPPPRNGMSVTTETLLQHPRIQGVRLVLVDTADRRGLRNVGRFDLRNVVVALRCGGAFFRELFRQRPDVVYVPVAQNGLGFLRDCLFLLPARVVRCPVVVHLHGSAFRQFVRDASPLVQILVRLGLSDVNCAVVLGDSASDQFEALLPASRVCVVDNGVPDNQPDWVPPDGSRLSGGRGTILCLGSLSLGKGFQDVLRAVAILDDLPDLRFVFAGEFRDAEAESLAAKIVRESGIGSRVDFIGPVSSLKADQLLRTAGALVMPARQAEGQPLVILEALRSGTPVVATRSGCIPDTIDDGVDGLLIDAASPESIAEALSKLTARDDAWRSMSVAARRTYESRYTAERWVSSMVRVFESAARSRRHSRILSAPEGQRQEL